MNFGKVGGPYERITPKKEEREGNIEVPPIVPYGAMVEPVIYGALTKLMPTMCSAQARPKCADLEFLAMECLEAYGPLRAQELCEDKLSDYKECLYGYKEWIRTTAMREEWKRKEKTVQRLETPPLDMFHF